MKSATAQEQAVKTDALALLPQAKCLLMYILPKAFHPIDEFRLTIRFF